jgi:protein gp37
MAEKTSIEWTDHTFNPWMGCMKVSPLCDNCYAETLVAQKKWFTPAPASDARREAVSYRWGAPGQGVGNRKRTSAATWKNPLRWDREAALQRKRPFVFCASLADVFDNAVPEQWRQDLFDLIRSTPNLVWLLLTKRPQNIEKMVAACGGLPSNVALGASAGLQREVRVAVAYLAQAKVTLAPAFTFISAEPLLEEISFQRDPDVAKLMSQIDWVIVGGESGAGAREMKPDWAETIRRQLRGTSTIFNFKQMGGFPGSGKGSHLLGGRTYLGRPIV